MQPFTKFTAVAAPLDQPNIDTDQIIPARFLGRRRDQQVGAMFHDVRFNEDGTPRPGFVLNQQAFAVAKIIAAERNFACGSSRENAVTVMMDNGFRVFIAPSFGDIFFNNCFQNGAVPVVLPEARVAAIRQYLHAHPGSEVTVDLVAQTVTGPDGKSDRFEIDPFRKECLVKGLDDISLTQSYEVEIRAFEERQRTEQTWL